MIVNPNGKIFGISIFQNREENEFFLRTLEKQKKIVQFLNIFHNYFETSNYSH